MDSGPVVARCNPPPGGEDARPSNILRVLDRMEAPQPLLRCLSGPRLVRPPVPRPDGIGDSIGRDGDGTGDDSGSRDDGSSIRGDSCGGGGKLDGGHDDVVKRIRATRISPPLAAAANPVPDPRAKGVAPLASFNPPWCRERIDDETPGALPTHPFTNPPDDVPSFPLRRRSPLHRPVR